MSKKPAKSDRSHDLPDWADDVTPADEVMKKFYAPTGAFKSGQIVPSEPDAQPLSPTVPPPDSIAAHENPQKQENQEDRVEIKEPTPTQASSPRDEYRVDSAKATTAVPASVPEVHTEPIITVLPSSTSDSPRPLKAAATVKTQLAPQPKNALTTGMISASDKTTQYEDFARKWRMYLYPGQLAVMRILYELTYAVGATECFTRYSEIARATKMSRRNSINVVNSLVNRGFVERLEVRNDASAKGIRLRIHLEPAS